MARPDGRPAARTPNAGDAEPRTSGDDAGEVLPAVGNYGATAWRVLEASTRLFGDRGFHGTSMRDIATAVGIKAASLYEHFGSKDEILATITMIGHEFALDEVRTAVEAASDSPRAQLTAYVRTAIATLCEWPQLAMVANDDLRSLPPALADRATAARDDLGLQLIDIVQRGVDDGEFADRDVVLVTASVASAIIRTPYWFTPTENRTVDAFATAYADLVVEMISRPA